MYCSITLGSVDVVIFGAKFGSSSAAITSSPVVTIRASTPLRRDTTSSFSLPNKNSILAIPKPPDARSVSFTVPAIVRNSLPITDAGIPRPLSVTVIVRFASSSLMSILPLVSWPFSSAPLIASNEFWNISLIDTFAMSVGSPYNLAPSSAARRLALADGLVVTVSPANSVVESFGLPNPNSAIGDAPSIRSSLPTGRAVRMVSVTSSKSASAFVSDGSMPIKRRSASTNADQYDVVPPSEPADFKNSWNAVSVIP